MMETGEGKHPNWVSFNTELSVHYCEYGFGGTWSLLQSEARDGIANLGHFYSRDPGEIYFNVSTSVSDDRLVFHWKLKIEFDGSFNLSHTIISMGKIHDDIDYGLFKLSLAVADSDASTFIDSGNHVYYTTQKHASLWQQFNNSIEINNYVCYDLFTNVGMIIRDIMGAWKAQQVYGAEFVSALSPTPVYVWGEGPISRNLDDFSPDLAVDVGGHRFSIASAVKDKGERGMWIMVYAAHPLGVERRLRNSGARSFRFTDAADGTESISACHNGMIEIEEENQEGYSEGFLGLKVPAADSDGNTLLAVISGIEKRIAPQLKCKCQ